MGNEASHVMALNIANAAMGIFVVGIFLAVAIAAAVDGVATLRRRRAEKGPQGGTTKAVPTPFAPPAHLNWKREKAS